MLSALCNENHRILEHAAKMAKDPSPSVRREVALAARYQPFDKARDILLEIAKAYDGEDRYYVEALGLVAPTRKKKMYAELKKHLPTQKYDPDTLVWFGVCIPHPRYLRLNHGRLMKTKPKIHRSMLFMPLV